MTKGIKTKDIRDFEKYAGKLHEVMERIWTYKPEASIYATPGELNLMAGFLDGKCSAQDEQEKMLVTTVCFSRLEAGDW